MTISPDDSPAVSALRLRIWNLRTLLSCELIDLWAMDFGKVMLEIAAIERERDALRKEKQP